MIQNPWLLISLSVIPRPPCAVFWWHHSRIIVVIGWFLGRSNGCFWFNGRFDLDNLPPTRRRLSWSKKGDSGWRLLVSLRFFPDINASYSFLNADIWICRMMDFVACSRAETSSGSWRFVFGGAFPILSFSFSEKWMTYPMILFTRDHDEFFFCRVSINAESPSTMMWCVVTFTSGSFSAIDLRFCLGQFSFPSLKNDGPLNHKSFLVLSGERPREAQSPEFSLDGTCSHWHVSVFSMMYCTLFATKTLNLFSVLLMYPKTTLLSVQKNSSWICRSSSFLTIFETFSNLQISSWYLPAVTSIAIIIFGYLG